MAENRLRTLLIEDNAADADLLQEVMGPAGEILFEFHSASSLAAGLARLAQGDVAVVLLDLGLPDSQGLNTLTEVCRQAPATPILVMTGLDDEALAVRAVQAGAQDYLIKGQVEGQALIRAIHYAVERKQAEVALRKANRTLNVISESNQALIHATDEAELLQHLCQIIVTVGGYPLVWIGFAEQDTAQTIRPVASAGNVEGYLAQTPLTWADTELGQGPTGRAIRTGQAAIVRDILTDPHHLPWRHEALRRGYQSALALPLLTDAGAMGAINICAPEPDAFPVSEVQLLAELAGDMAYGILALRTRAERQKAEAALRASETRYREVSELISDYAYAYRVEHNGQLILEWVTEAFARITGFKPEELESPGGWMGLIHPEDRSQAQQHQLTLLTGQASVMEFRIMTKAGTVRWLRDYGQPVWNETEGRVVRLYGAAQDITQQREVEEGRRLLQYAVEQSPASIVITDLDGNIEYINPKFAHVSGYAFEEVRGRNPRLLKSGLTPPETYTQLWEALTAGREWQGEICNRRKTGELWWEQASISPVRDGTGQTVHFVAIKEDITQRKQAEAALAASEKRYRALYQSMMDAYSLVDMQGHIREYNEAYRAMLGYSDEELQQLTYLDLTPEKWHSHEQKIVIEQVVPLGYSEVYQKEYRRKDGSIFPIELRTYLIRDDAGQPDGMWAIIRDITERKRAEEALRQNEERFRTVADFTYDWEYWVGPDGHHIYVSPSCQELTGYAAEEFLQNPELLLRLVHPDDRTLLAAHQHDTFDSREAQTVDFRIVKRSGEIRWLNHICRPVYSAEGQWLGRRATNRDITDRRLAEALLQNQYSILQGILNSTNDVVFSLDQNYRYTGFNPAHAALMRAIYGVEIQVGQNLLDYMTVTADRDQAKRNLDRALAGEQFTEESYTGDELLSRIYVEVSHNPIRDTEGQVIGVAVFSRDISARRRAEEALLDERRLLAQRVEERTAELSARTAELSLANAALNRAAHLKDEFLASMSHELRTPLTGILGLSETLQMGIYGAVTDKQKEILQTVNESGQHLLGLINDILDLSKVEAGKMELKIERTIVSDVCLASVQFVKETAHKKSLHLATHLDANVTVIQADARRLKQMLVNLLGNAVKFTPEGGEVGLNVEGDAAHQVMRFVVWDTGIGIAAADIERLFTPFVQLDSRLSREYSGTGLGLSLVLRMAELHGGGVTVESEGVPGKGSRFVITLPWHEADQPTDTFRANPSGEVPLQVRRAFTVEDTAVAAEQLTCYLTELGIVNTVQACGAGALEKVLEVQPDVILLDILLPDISGWEVLRQLKADPRTRAIPVIVVSVVDDRTRGEVLGADGYLAKPVALSDLQTALSACTRRGGQRDVQSAMVVIATDRPLILLADDNNTVMLTLSGFLKAHAYRLIIAHNGGEALDSVHHQCPDLILMDIQMPGIDGLEAIHRLRADPDPRVAAVPIIALTALAMPGDRERCLAAGASDYLTKPVNLGKLIEMLEGLLKGN